MEKEELLLCKRFQELATSADYKYSNTFTSFLTLNEVSLFYQKIRELPNVPFSMFGGYLEAERKMICFHGETHRIETAKHVGTYNEIELTVDEMNEMYPICCVQISPVHTKFCDALTHRDYLGALMNLGIDRSKLGDILIDSKETRQAYLFCDRYIAGYIKDTLVKVKHTNVTCKLVDYDEQEITQDFIEVHGTVSSIRLDAMIAVAFKTSRSSITGLIEGGKVFVNGKETVSNSYILKENDIVSVRGMGKFIYTGSANQTKKGRYSVTIKRYN